MDKAYKARWSILKVLTDGQWHRNMELKEKTKLSSRTLAKHLDQMRTLRIIERMTDIKSGKYPTPVLYKTAPKLTIYMKSRMSREAVANRIISSLNRTKDPLIVLEEIHAFSQECLIELLTAIQQNKIITDEEINFFAEYFLWASYKQYISELVKASRRIINKLNMPQLLIDQAKRQIKINKKILKAYGECAC